MDEAQLLKGSGPIVVRLLGDVRIEVPGTTGSASPLNRQARLVLARLALDPHAVTREELADLLWQNDLPGTWESALRSVVSRVRKAFDEAGLDGSTLLRSAFGCWQLHLPEDVVVLDVAEARRHLRNAEVAVAEGNYDDAVTSSIAAEELLVLPFLPGTECDWAFQRRTEIARDRRSALDCLLNAHLEAGRPKVAERVARQLLREDPYDESVHRQLMLALFSQHNRAGALRAYDDCRRLLATELGVSPSGATDQLYQSIIAMPEASEEKEASSAPDMSEPAIPFPTRLLPPAPLPFRGRSDEVDALNRVWDRALAGSLQLVLVSGEAGIGKSRLAAEFARRVFDDGAVVLFGRSGQDLGLPFQPFVEALDQMADAAMTADDYGQHASELVRLAPVLAGVVPGLDTPTQPDPETERYRLFEAVAAWFEAISRPSGLLFVVDDVHWADRPTLSLLRHLVRIPSRSRVVIVVTHRDSESEIAEPLSEFLADLRRDANVERLALRGLDSEAVLELLDAGADATNEVRRFAFLLCSDTNGNPFFLQEVILSLGDQVRNITSDLFPKLSQLGVPRGIREVVRGRTAKLSRTAINAISIGSVLGDTIDSAVVSDVTGIDLEDVLDALDEAVRSDLLRGVESGSYVFIHALVRSSVYDELSSARRALRHRQVGEALEARGAEPATLAFHFNRVGGDEVRAFRYSAEAGDLALAQLAFDQAVVFFQQAVERARSLGLGHRELCRVMVRLGTAQKLAGDPSYRSTLLSAAELAAAEPDLLVDAALANTRGLFSQSGVADHERIGVIGRALDAVGTGDSPERARLLALLAVELTFDDPASERFAMADHAIAVARRIGDQRCLLDVSIMSHISCWVAGRVPDMVDQIPELVELAQRVGDEQQLAFACAWGFSHNMELGRLEEADRLLGLLLATAESAVNPVLNWVAMSWRCGRLMLTASPAEIEAAAFEALGLGQELNQPDAFTWFGPQFVVAQLNRGRVEALLDLIRNETQANPGLVVWQCGLSSTLAQIWQAEHAQGRGEPAMADEARALVDAITRNLGVIPYDYSWLLAVTLLAEAVARVGTPEQADILREVLTPYATRLPSVGSQVWPCVSLQLGGLVARLGDSEGAIHYFEQAMAVHERLGAVAWEPRTRLDWGRHLLEAGQTEQARIQLQRAQQSAEALGAEGFVEKTRVLLVQT